MPRGITAFGLACSSPSSNSVTRDEVLAEEVVAARARGEEERERWVCGPEASAEDVEEVEEEDDEEDEGKGKGSWEEVEDEEGRGEEDVRIAVVVVLEPKRKENIVDGWCEVLQGGGDGGNHGEKEVNERSERSER